MKHEFEDAEFLSNMNDVRQEQLGETTENLSDAKLMTLSEAGTIVFGAQAVSDLPAVREKINECKDEFLENVKNGVEEVKEFGEYVVDGLKDFCGGVYDDVKGIFGSGSNELPESMQSPEMARLSEGITEGREFGLEECSEAALEIFNAGVINEWGSLTQEQRKDIACMYADRVAQAFELNNYKGVYIEELEPGVLGYNNGDGTIHLSDTLVDGTTTPFEIMNTITHELRHQYQSECVKGGHEVSEEVRNEWSIATGIYNYDTPSCYDPWGYTYNPLEIDARYAGETVVRNVSSQLLNDTLAATQNMAG